MLFILQSCASYQYLTIESQDLFSEENVYYHETEDYRLEYRFDGRNLPINITIENKSMQPIYVDWSKSAAVANGFPLSYIPDNTFSGTSHIRTSSVIENYSETRFSGSMSNNPHVSFIPPNSKKQRTVLQLISSMNNSGQNIPMDLDRDMEYTIDDSALKFRSYLTIYKNESMEKEEIIDHSFFVRYSKTKEQSPTSIDLNENESYMVVYDEDNFKNGLKTVGVLSISGILLVLAIAFL
jgi:hypothetical protein